MNFAIPEENLRLVEQSKPFPELESTLPGPRTAIAANDLLQIEMILK